MIKKMFSQIFNQFFLMEKVHVGEGWGGEGGTGQKTSGGGLMKNSIYG